MLKNVSGKRGLQSEVSPLKPFNKSPGTEGTAAMSGIPSQGLQAAAAAAAGEGRHAQSQTTLEEAPLVSSRACLEASTSRMDTADTSPTERSWPPRRS